MAIENGALSSTYAERADVDTALPFESVKVAVSLFGNQIGAKKTSFLEKCAVQEGELLHAQEELRRVKELLKIAQQEKEKALQDLAQGKAALDQTSQSLKALSTSEATMKQEARLDGQACGQVLSSLEDKYVLWESKLRCAIEKHTAAVLEMEISKQQLADLKQELLVSSNEQEAVFKQTEAALGAMESNAKASDYLGTDLAGVNNWLAVLKHACSSDATKSSSKVTVGGEACTVSQGSDMANELELKLLAMMNESIRVREELKHAKDEEEKGIATALELLAFVEAMRLELWRVTEMGEGLKKEKSCNRASLVAILESLKVQMESLHRQIGALAARETIAVEKSMVLGTELAGVRAEFEEAKAEARESTLKLLQALKEAEADIAKGRREAEAVREEISLTRSRTATVEAKSIVSISQLSQALKQAEADLTEARGEIQALREEELSHAAAAKESIAQLSQALQKAQAEADHTTQVLQEVSGAKARSDADADSIEQTSQALKQAQEQLDSVTAEREALQKEASRLESCKEAAEAKAEESVSQLTKALEQAIEEVAHAKAEMEALREEMLRGKASAVKQVTFVMPNDEARTVEDSKEDGDPARPVRADGSAVLSIPARASEVGENEWESIPTDQSYESLKKKLQDAVKKVTESNRPSAAETSKRDVPRDLESMQTALKHALHRAEMAEAGKISLESELRRLRQKERSMAFAIQQNLPKAFEGKDGAGAKPWSEPLGNVLNINISAEKTKTLVRIGSRRLKKANTSTYTSTYFASKKA